MANKYKILFVDVDTQYDFMDPHGALYVPDAALIVPNLQRLFAAAAEHSVPIVSTADHHAQDDPEFTAYGFAPHCVAGTPGAQRLPYTLMADRAAVDPDETIDDIHRLLDQHAQVIFRKRTLDLWTSKGAQSLLKQVDADAWYVFGVATDYCVKSAALGLARAGKPTYVVTDAVKAITPAGEKAAFEEMKTAGVELITTDAVLSRLATRPPDDRAESPLE